MAKEIGLKLKITSDGTEKVISSITELEAELASLQKTLKTAEFGSKQFKEAAANIQTLKSRIEDVDKTTEGVGIEKRLRAIGDTTNLVSGSFQVLSGVIGTLTTNEETLKEVQEAEARALNVLNIALGVRSIQEGILESKIFRRELAEKAATITSKAYITTAKGVSAVLGLIGIEAGVASVGVRALTTALAALGIPLLIIGLTTLIDKFGEINTEAPKIKTAKEAYDDFNASLAKTNELADARIGYIKAIGEDEAAFDAELAKISEERAKRSQKEIDLFDDLTTAQQKLDFATKDRQEKDIAAANERIKQIKENIDANLVANIKLEAQFKATEKAKTDFLKQEEDKRNQKTKEARDKREQLAVQEIQARLQIQKNYLAELQKLTQTEIEVSAEVLDKYKDIIAKQEDLIKERNDFAKSESQKLGEDIKTLLFDTIPTEEELKKLQDFFLKIFKTINTGLAKEPGEAGFIQLPTEQIKNFEEIIKLYKEAGGTLDIKSKDITEEAQRDLSRYFNLYIKFADELKKPDNQKLLTKSLKGDDKEIRNFLDDLILEGQKVLKDTTLLEGQAEKNLTKFIQDRLQLREKSLRGLSGITKENTIKDNEAIKDFTNTLVSFSLAEGKVVVETDKVAAALTELFIKVQANEGTLGRFDVIVGKVNGELAAFVGNVVKPLTDTEIENFTKRLTDAFSNSSEAFTGFLNNIINNTDDIRTKLLSVLKPEDLVKVLQTAANGLENITFNSVEEVQSLITAIETLQLSFAEVIPGSSGVFAFNDILDKLIKKLGEVKTATTEVKKTFQETFSESEFKKIADIILSTFTTISSQLSSIVQQQNSLLLEQLDYQQAQALKAVEELGDESVEGQRVRDAERLKIEKEYQKKKFDAEKKARVQELQFALANATAQGAQAILNAYATLPVAAAIPFSLVLAALTATQIATINDQLQFTQNKAYLGRTGGLVEGSSHDSYGGGVPTMLEGGEFILNKEAVRSFGDTISSINTATGGKPMAIDDSRLVQAINKQNLNNKTPLKAFVLFQDIQDTTKLNNKIEQLARL